MRLSSAEGVSGAESLDPGVHSAHRAGAVAGAAEALSVVAQGMERAVRVGRGRSLEEIDSQGLSVADIFYSEVLFFPCSLSIFWFLSFTQFFQ